MADIMHGQAIEDVLDEYHEAQAAAEWAWAQREQIPSEEDTTLLQMRAIGLGINAGVLILESLYKRQVDEDTLLTTKQAAQESGFSIAAIRRWTDEGALESFRTPGNQRRIPRSALKGIVRPAS